MLNFLMPKHSTVYRQNKLIQWYNNEWPKVCITLKTIADKNRQIRRFSSAIFVGDFFSGSKYRRKSAIFIGNFLKNRGWRRKVGVHYGHHIFVYVCSTNIFRSFSFTSFWNLILSFKTFS